MALVQRRAGIVRRPGRPGQFLNPLLQRLDPREQRQDERILARMTELAEVTIGCHSDGELRCS